MKRQQTFKNRKSLRRKSRIERRKYKGAGWSDGPDMVNPGNLVHHQYSGPGKDCTGNPHSIRPGYIFDYSSKGIPGLSGGALMPITNPNLPPVNGSLTPKPGDFPNTTGTSGTVANPNNLPVVMSMPGVPTPGAAQIPSSDLKQSGGRYGFFPEIGPLNPINGIGTSPGPFGRIPCETGTYNPLNPNPDNIQRLSTAPLTPPFVSGRLAGGANNFPTVQVGQADSMRYYAPTAGYRNDFMTFRAPSAVPGLTIQTPYDAKAFNQSCIKTGGSRKNKKRGGASPVAYSAGKFTPVTINEIWSRKDFDGTNKGLPVKFGGKRRTRRVLKNKHKLHKNHK